MITVINVPHIDTNSQSVSVVSVEACVGDRVDKGQEVCVLETMKTTVSIESEVDGYIRIVLAKTGDEIKYDRPIIVISSTESEYINEKEYTKPKENSTDIKITKKALLLAEKNNIDIGLISPSGDLIRSNDILLAMNRSENFIKRELTNIEKGSLDSLSFHKRHVVTAYLERVIDFKDVVVFANKFQKDNGLIFNPFFSILTWVFVKTVCKFNTINSYYNDSNSEVVISKKVNLGITMDVSGDLFLPVLHNASDLNLKDFINEVYYMQKMLYKRELNNDQLHGASICISSLAAFNISKHVPIIAPNTSFMLALSDFLPFTSANSDKFSVVGCSYDHRIHNGVQISKVLRYFENQLQNLTSS